ncbi:hypothetical protein B0H34DRAFT_477459 [Crassisporium funariophilum]|nr:hypothetical protein B0H34DRAFT_477459 [Crassisporium funariophilum]
MNRAGLFLFINCLSWTSASTSIPKALYCHVSPSLDCRCCTDGNTTVWYRYFAMQFLTIITAAIFSATVALARPTPQPVGPGDLMFAKPKKYDHKLGNVRT